MRGSPVEEQLPSRKGLLRPARRSSSRAMLPQQKRSWVHKICISPKAPATKVNHAPAPPRSRATAIEIATGHRFEAHREGMQREDKATHSHSIVATTPSCHCHTGMSIESAPICARIHFAITADHAQNEGECRKWECPRAHEHLIPGNSSL